MKKKILITAGVITIIILLTILQGKVNAATLQSNPNTHYKTRYAPENVIKSIRTMEASGGAMGLSETVKTDQTFIGESNNIDVHMMRNTEYGAIAILSVSGYGNSKTIPNSTIKSTTGNQTGIYYISTGSVDYYHLETIAGGRDGVAFKNIDKRYYDSYGKSKTSKTGDAFNLEWQGGNVEWLKNSAHFMRNWKSFFGVIGDEDTSVDTGYSRGVAVCGTGF